MEGISLAVEAGRRAGLSEDLLTTLADQARQLSRLADHRTVLVGRLNSARRYAAHMAGTRARAIELRMAAEAAEAQATSQWSQAQAEVAALTAEVGVLGRAADTPPVALGAGDGRDEEVDDSEDDGPHSQLGAGDLLVSVEASSRPRVTGADGAAGAGARRRTFRAEPALGLVLKEESESDGEAVAAEAEGEEERQRKWVEAVLALAQGPGSYVNIVRKLDRLKATAQPGGEGRPARPVPY